ncbi:F0F1 ATP synthase subunit epsilon [Tenuifilum thalassicum]|uniref:F0F1 ATP synthase subunit epsilon n=1 Tax=Tenuifilum thalassicum TaxID=2590900 RepID=A0A7D4BG69_9BACT|nr:F0F1 ATP synthase subunit epsilon [Tenuifilum thalassicum]QKG81118.1 F0F1 ATP synthase subunit epsilon [Tenuifilum thalassicum]
MICELYSVEKFFQIEEVYYVQVPGTKGSFGILKKHAPIISSLEPGIVKVVRNDGAEILFSIPAGGFVSFENDVVSIVSEEITQTY